MCCARSVSCGVQAEKGRPNMPSISSTVDAGDTKEKKSMTFEEKEKQKAAETLALERKEARLYQEELKAPSNKTGTTLHPLFPAVAAGNNMDVEMLLESLGTSAPDVVMQVDDKGRTTLHIAGKLGTVTV